MPPLSLLSSGVSLKNQKIILRNASGNFEEVAIGYGELIEVLIDFLIITLAIFMVVKLMNRIRKKAEDPTDKEVETPKDIELLSNIEKLLENQNKLLKK